MALQAAKNICHQPKVGNLTRFPKLFKVYILSRALIIQI
jgi:hypothetical protein